MIRTRHIFYEHSFYFGSAHDLASPMDHGSAESMGHARQSSFFKSNKFQYQHGGELRRKRAGRGKRPLSTKDSLHVVLKMNREAHRPGLRPYKSYALSMQVIDRYAKRFFIKIIQISIQGNHVHINADPRAQEVFVSPLFSSGGGTDRARPRPARDRYPQAAAK